MKAAIFGAGFIAEFHALGYSQAQDAALCAVCDIDEEKARALADRYGCAWYTDAAALLREQQPELVSICLPTHLHRDYACMALESGAHVLCEKPFALTMEDCLAMQEAAKKAGRMLMVAQVLRWWPEYTAIADQIRRLGTPQYLRARRLQHPARESWHMQRNLGGGALFDLFVHDVDFILSLMGTQAQVAAASGCRGKGDSWRQVSAMLRFENGACAQIQACSQMPAGYPFTAEFSAQYEDAAIDYRFCTAVNIERSAKADTTFLLYDKGAITPLPQAHNAQEAAFIAQVDAFVRGVKTGVSPLPIEESIDVMRVIHAICETLEAQEKVKHEN